MTSQKTKRIPYGVGDYKKLRQNNCYYVDKTRHIPLLEAAPFYVFLIRPRRFGKTLWQTLLEYYYDINEADNFENLFADTYIGQNPTEQRNSYLVISFNFSAVNPSVQFVHQSFAEYGATIIKDFLKRYTQFFSQEDYNEILSVSSVEGQLKELFTLATHKNLKVYLFIDEYDNFANTILTTEGEQAYRNLTHGAGFFRYFFNTLKAATTGRMGGITRLFITGVSPIAMDDVTSGFNIGHNLSLSHQFNSLMGFNEDEVKEMLSHYNIPTLLNVEMAFCLNIMRAWYDGYYFSETTQEKVFNSDMVLYFIHQALTEGKIPSNLIDQNVRTDYGKLRHLITVDQQLQDKKQLNNNRRLNGNFSLLKQIIETGQTTSEIVLSFPLERLQKRENFISLLYYLGLLTFTSFEEGEPLLSIPNRSIKKLMYGYLREGYEDVNIFRLDLYQLAQLLRKMAYRGEWEALFDFLSDEIKAQASVHDYLDGEKMVQGFLLAYLNFSNFFLTWSEREMTGGFVDIYLEPFLARYKDMKYGYLIELKYISKSQFDDEKLKGKVADAKKQLQKYANDERLKQVAGQVSLIKLILVYKGWELVYREVVQ